MSEENEAVVRRAFDEVAMGDMTTVDEIIAPEFVRHDLAGGPEAHGPDGVKRLIAGLRTGFPDLQTTIEDIFSDGEKVVVRFTAQRHPQRPVHGDRSHGQGGDLERGQHLPRVRRPDSRDLAAGGRPGPAAAARRGARRALGLVASPGPLGRPVVRGKTDG